MTGLDGLSVLLCLMGGVFYLAGTVGMLRFPNTWTRLHALTKADNLGLGLVVAALVLQADSLPGALKLVLIWVLAVLAGTNACYLVGRHLLAAEERSRAEDAAR
jgi:multicomponent Na+:H+ antiporter subunit G